MRKDFKKWYDKKTRIDEIQERPFFHEREIWFCYLGINVGFEQDGYGEDFQRPVVIVRKFNSQVAWVVPLSKTNRRNKYYLPFSFNEKVISVAVVSQLRLLDAKRLTRLIGTIKEEDFGKLISTIKALLP